MPKPRGNRVKGWNVLGPEPQLKQTILWCYVWIVSVCLTLLNHMIRLMSINASWRDNPKSNKQSLQWHVWIVPMCVIHLAAVQHGRRSKYLEGPVSVVIEGLLSFFQGHKIRDANDPPWPTSSLCPLVPTALHSVPYEWPNRNNRPHEHEGTKIPTLLFMIALWQILSIQVVDSYTIPRYRAPYSVLCGITAH